MKKCKISSIYGGRTYLKELSEKLELTMRKTSNMVGKLRDQGLVIWAHDGDGSEGTYVMITDLGRKLLQEQEEIIKDYYGNVIQKFGKDNFIQLLQLISQFPLLAVYGYNDYNHYEKNASMIIHNPDPKLSTAENILMLIRPNKAFSKVEAKVLDTALILHMEHGGGNSNLP